MKECFVPTCIHALGKTGCNRCYYGELDHILHARLPQHIHRCQTFCQVAGEILGLLAQHIFKHKLMQKIISYVYTNSRTTEITKFIHVRYSFASHWHFRVAHLCNTRKLTCDWECSPEARNANGIWMISETRDGALLSSSGTSDSSRNKASISSLPYLKDRTGVESVTIPHSRKAMSGCPTVHRAESNWSKMSHNISI